MGQGEAEGVILLFAISSADLTGPVGWIQEYPDNERMCPAKEVCFANVIGQPLLAMNSTTTQGPYACTNNHSTEQPPVVQPTLISCLPPLHPRISFEQKNFDWIRTLPDSFCPLTDLSHLLPTFHCLPYNYSTAQGGH